MRAEGQPGIAALRVDVIVCDDSAVLLVQPSAPLHGSAEWGLPGDAVRFGEAPEASSRRVLKDQLGLEPEWVQLAEVESTMHEGVWTLTFHFRCDADRPPQPGPQLADARFFQAEHLPPTAHGTHERDIIFRVLTAGSAVP